MGSLVSRFRVSTPSKPTVDSVSGITTSWDCVLSAGLFKICKVENVERACDG